MHEHEATFGEQLRRLRLRAGLSQAALAERANLSPAAVATLERGSRSAPYPRTLDALAAALGLSAPERAALVAASGRATRSGHGAPARTDQSAARAPRLPVWLTSLVGRGAEVDAARTLLDPRVSTVRLLTLVGPGGVGKTRLAVAVAGRLADAYPGGVIFVDLTPLHDARLAAATIARALDLRESDGRSARELLLEHLRERQALLVLDNFEHVLGAAPLVTEVLHTCHRVSVLVTSRTVLRIQDERRFTVAPLLAPGAETDWTASDIIAWPAVRLFVERAQALAADFVLTPSNAAAVASVCHRLDGLPLALELAAARVPLLSPEALLKRLERRMPVLTVGALDLPDRQRTLRTTLAWSFDLLEPALQILFRRLAVFAGGWTLEAAEAVCADAPRSADEVLDQLQALMDSSLVRRLGNRQDQPRFALLQTIREFALEQLDAHAEAEDLRRRHATYFLAVAEEAAPNLSGSDRRAWLDQLDAELDNLRVVLGWAQESGELELGLRLAVALATFWEERGHLREGRDSLEALARGLVERNDSPRLAALYARALGVTAWVAFLQGDYRAAAPLADQSLDRWRQLGEGGNSPVALNTLAYVAGHQGNPARQEALFQQSLAMCRAQGDLTGSAAVLSWLGTLRRAADDLDGATALLEESLALFRVVGDNSGIAFALQYLGGVAAARQDFTRAQALFDQSLALYADLADSSDVAYVQGALAGLALDRGDFTRAQALCSESVATFRQLGDARGLAVELSLQGRIAALQGDDESAAAAYSECLALNHAVGRVDLVFGLEGLAQVLAGLAKRQVASNAQLERAVRLFGASAGLRRTLGAAASRGWSIPLARVNHDEYDQQVAAARAALGAEVFDAAWAAGQRLPLEQTIADVLAGTPASEGPPPSVL